VGNRSGDTFTIQGNIHILFYFPKPVETALFRFTGDPAQLDELHLTSVLDLVDRVIRRRRSRTPGC